MPVIDTPDPKQVRILRIRWRILRTLLPAGQIGANEGLLRDTLGMQRLECTETEIRNVLAYLQDLGYCVVSVDYSLGEEIWSARLTPNGFDYAEYRLPPDLRIPRPAKG